MEIEIKPCPCCKSDDYVKLNSVFLKSSKRDIFYIECSRCNLKMTRYCNYREDRWENVLIDLVDSWNNRKKIKEVKS